MLRLRIFQPVGDILLQMRCTWRDTLFANAIRDCSRPVGRGIEGQVCLLNNSGDRRHLAARRR
jgi:hypothetical protein